MFSVAASGAVTPLGGPPPDPTARSVVFSPSGALLAAANTSSDSVSMFSVGSSGALTSVSGSPFTLAAEPTSVVFSPNGELLAVTAGKEEAQSLYMFSVSSSGALTPVPGSPYSVSSSDHVAFSPTGGLLAAQLKTGVKMFSVSSSGTLTEVPGSPFAVAESIGPKGLAFRSNGNLLTSFLSNGPNPEVITTYSVASSGALTLLASGAGSKDPQGGASSVFSPDGSTVVSPQMDSSYLYVLSVSQSGAVTVLPNEVFSTGPSGDAAVSSGGLLALLDEGVSVYVPSSTSASTNWVGALGSEGYDLLDWDSEGDVSDIPASVSLVKGARCMWAANTSNVLALTSPDGLTRTAAGYCNPELRNGEKALGETQVKLTFSRAYTGNLRVYSVLWEGAQTAEGKPHESITVGGKSVPLEDNGMQGNPTFSEGGWALFPVSEPAGASLTISGEVLSGIFLGEAGPPPAMATSTSPQGAWTGALGSAGYDLAAWDGQTDASALPNASLSLTQGSRYEWASSTEDPRALQSPDGLAREAATYYDPSQIRLSLKFNSAYSGNLHLYAVDWDSTARRELISVDGQTADLSSSFNQGAWVSLPISVAAGETVSIVVDREAGANAVLSGIFLGEAGPPPVTQSPSAVQGNWVGSYGSAGYDLSAWSGASDLVSIPSAAVSLAQGSRYVWASSTSDVRALESPEKTTREAATYFDPGQIRLSLKFNTAYSGNLRLYAVDWDSTARRELISVDGQTADLSSSFNQGAWVSFPISVAAGESVSIVVDRTAGANAVLSGVFLGDAGSPPGPASAPQGTLIPLYDNGKQADWTEACSQANGSGGGSWIIADVAEGLGPGSASVPAWASLLANCRSYDRASVIGYVWTDYGEGGQASIAGIESQVNAWYSYYPGQIAGIFFDGVSDDVPGTSTSNQSFYRTLASYVHTHEGSGAEVVFNFGANPGSAWMLNSTEANNANLVVTFEGSYDTPGEDPYTSWAQASWEAAYPAHDFAALIYNAPDEAVTPQPASACTSLARQNIGYSYVGTWYDELPPYFSSFLTDAFSGGC